MIGLKSRAKTIEQITAPIAVIVAQLHELSRQANLDSAAHADVADENTSLSISKGKEAVVALMLAEKYAKLLS